MLVAAAKLDSWPPGYQSGWMPPSTRRKGGWAGSGPAGLRLSRVDLFLSRLRTGSNRHEVDLSVSILCLPSLQVCTLLRIADAPSIHSGIGSRGTTLAGSPVQ